MSKKMSKKNSRRTQKRPRYRHRRRNVSRVRRTKRRGGGGGGGGPLSWFRGTRNQVSSDSSDDESVDEPVKEHIGISLDWDGCGDVLPALFMLMTNKTKQQREAKAKEFAYGERENVIISQYTIKSAKKLVETILSYLPRDPCVVHMFIGSNRQSYDIDNDIAMYHTRVNKFGTYMYGYWKTLEEVMNNLYKPHNWIFETGSCSDHETAPTNPQNILDTIHMYYGSGFEKGLPLNHDFNVSKGSNLKDELNLKDSLNRYHAWILHSVYRGNRLIFFDDKIKFVDGLTKTVGIHTYPPNMTIIGHHFDRYNKVNKKVYEIPTP